MLASGKVPSCGVALTKSEKGNCLFDNSCDEALGPQDFQFFCSNYTGAGQDAVVSVSLTGIVHGYAYANCDDCVARS